jgi:hypothetical protein
MDLKRNLERLLADKKKLMALGAGIVALGGIAWLAESNRKKGKRPGQMGLVARGGSALGF